MTAINKTRRMVGERRERKRKMRLDKKINKTPNGGKSWDQNLRVGEKSLRYALKIPFVKQQQTKEDLKHGSVAR